MLLLLLQNKDARYCSVILVLGLMIIFGGMRINELDAELLKKPRIETKILTQVQTRVVSKEVEGPERIVEHEVMVPGTSTVQYIDRVIYKEPVTITTEKETERKSEAEKIVMPACPDVSGNRWIAGLGVNPLHASDFPTLRGGYSFWNKLDLSVSYLPPAGRVGLEAALRFK